MEYGFSLVVRGSDAGPATFDAMAQKAEATGVERLWASDHIFFPKFTVSKHPATPDGKLPDHWRTAYWQPFSVLNYLAARTTRVRLGTSVLILPMRNPIEVAAQVAELDQLSGGRIDFGVGVGWVQEEIAALGYPFKERGARCNEGLDVCKALWTQDKVTFKGRFTAFDEASFAPKPAQRPHPPIYVGGSSEGALRRVARYGDVWHPFLATPEQIAELRPVLQRLLEAEGRAGPLPIVPKLPLVFQDGPAGEGQLPSIGRPQDIVDTIRRYEDVGATGFLWDLAPETSANALDTMERFSQDVRAKLA